MLSDYIGVLDTLRYSNTDKNGFRVEPNEVRFVSRKPLLIFSLRIAVNDNANQTKHHKWCWYFYIGLLDTLRYSKTEHKSVFE